MKKTGIVSFLVLFSIQFAIGQEFLVLEKMGTKKRYEYYPDDKITFKTDEGGFRSDVIVALTDSAIVFEGGEVPFKDIRRVKLSDKKGWMTGVGATLMVAGVGYFLIDQLNNSVVQGNSPSTNEGVLRASAIIAGTGAAFFFLSKKSVNTTKNWRLRFVNIY